MVGVADRGAPNYLSASCVAGGPGPPAPVMAVTYSFPSFSPHEVQSEQQAILCSQWIARLGQHQLGQQVYDSVGRTEAECPKVWAPGPLPSSPLLWQSCAAGQLDDWMVSSLVPVSLSLALGVSATQLTEPRNDWMAGPG